MKKSALITLILLVSCISLNAQTATGILDNYIKNSGGQKAWQDIKAIKIDATVNQDDMVIPVTLYSTASGKQAVILTFPGRDITQLAFDGDTYWSTDYNTLQPVKANEEILGNVKLGNNDFPSPALNYKKNGYTIAFVGIEKKSGAETYKVKIIQEPMSVNGVKIPNISYYYFDTLTYLPVVVETTQPDGQMNSVILADYQKVKGLDFAFSIDQEGTPITVKTVTLNPQIDASVFSIPAEKLPGANE